MHPKAKQFVDLAEQAANRYNREPLLAAQFETGYLRGVVDKLCRDLDEMHKCLVAAHDRIPSRSEETAEVA